MKILLSKTEFNISLFSVLVYLVLLILLISLGFWQLGRAEEKRLFIAKRQDTVDKEQIKVDQWQELAPESLRFRKTAVSGVYDQQHQYLIDNQIVHGQVGYFVMTPLILDGMNKAVLVNRGWVALNRQRSELPDLSISAEKVSITGRINHFPVVGIQLPGAEIPTEGWPSVVQVVDTNILTEKLGYPLFPFQIELDADLENGYLRDWKENKVIPPEKHIAYAIQWFGLAVTLTVLIIWLSSKK